MKKSTMKTLRGLKGQVLGWLLVVSMLPLNPALKAARAAQAKDLVDTAVAAGKFNTLVVAVKAADLVETLNGPGPFTVFAPTDQAFDALPAGTLEAPLKPENKNQLTSILTYHVVPGKIMSRDVLKLSRVQTVQGQAAETSLAIDGARVIQADIACSNGVIHVIDKVMLP